MKRIRGRVANALWHWYDLLRLTDRPKALPVNLWVEPTTVCNLRCVMCSKSREEDSTRNISLSPEFIERLLPEAHSASFAMLLGFGEPFISPSFFPWLEKLISIGCTITASSNALLLDDEKIERILNSGISQLSFSLDGTKAETFAEVRKSKQWEKALANIKNFIEKRNAKGTHLPFSRITLVMVKDNLKDVPEFADLAVSLGIPYISIMDPVFYSRESAEKCVFPIEEPVPYVSALEKRAKELGVDMYYFEDSYYVYLDSIGEKVGSQKETPVEKYKDSGETLICPFLYSMLYVRADGLVAPCCYLYEQVVGDLNKSTVSEIWHGDALASYRKRIKEGDYPPGCRVCQRLVPYDRKQIWKNGKTFLKHTIDSSRKRKKEGFALQPLFFIV